MTDPITTGYQKTKTSSRELETGARKGKVAADMWLIIIFPRMNIEH